jgi:hypothetical protein
MLQLTPFASAIVSERDSYVYGPYLRREAEGLASRFKPHRGARRLRRRSDRLARERGPARAIRRGRSPRVGDVVRRVLLGLALVAALAAASSTDAGTPPHVVVLLARVCDRPLVLRAPTVPPATHGGRPTYIYAWVNGRRMSGVVKGSTIYLVGDSTVVQVPMFGAAVVRAVRTIPRCALLRVKFAW